MKSSNKKYLIFGVIIGLLLAFLYFHYFAPRYEIKKTGISLVKIDKWTGSSWRFVDNNWKKMVDMDENWERVDKTLQEALKVPFVEVDTGSALMKLREKYPVLKDLSDDELQERIKLVYSKLVLLNLYLNDFLKTNQDTKTREPAGDESNKE
ncbi:MAG: hypothetical protein JRC68_00455 [Deltaproteobacteria bacterium]|nr:hypothetical protein [Deltaproteobacteria bacterium]